MKKLLYLIFLLGALLGPVYYIWATYASGGTIMEKTVYSREIDLGDFKYRSESIREEGTWRRPVTLNLSPGNNPYRLIARSNYVISRTIGSRSTGFDFTLTNGRQTVWENTAHFNARKVKRGTIRIADSETVVEIFSVDEPGDYTLHVAFSNTATLPIKNLTLELKGNVRIPIPAVYITGIGFLLVGIAGLWILESRQKQ